MTHWLILLIMKLYVKVVSEVIMGAHHDLLESLAEEIASKGSD